MPRSELYNPYIWLGIIGIVIFLIGGTMMVIGIGESDNASLGTGVGILSFGIILLVIFVLFPEKKNEKKTSSWNDLRMHVRVVAENIQKEFENPVKIDVYEKDYRTASLFAPPSTITIYEEIDPSKESEKPNPFAPRYMQLESKKKYNWKSFLSMFKRRNLVKSNDKGAIERRMLCAFRDEVPTRAALIIEDVRDRVEKYILIEFDHPNITYEKRISKEDMAFFRNQQRSFEV